jgi:hypothetical protein
MAAWSYSALQLFETCPRKFQALRVTKEVKEGETEALRWGNWLHKQFEDYVKARGQFVIPKEIERYRKLLDTIVSLPGEKYPEFQVALRVDLSQTGFFAKDVWTRGKLDVLIIDGKTAVVLDYKTGKPKSDDTQAKLFALYVFSLFPHVEEVKSGFVWVAEDVKNPIDIKTYSRSDSTLLWGEFLPRIKMFEDAHTKNEWPVRPSGLCKKHCPVTSCPHNGANQ